VSLIAGEIEKVGIATVNLVLLRFIAEEVQPPRALFVPFNHGYPLNQPNDPPSQIAVIEAAFQLLEDKSLQPPVLADYQP
jgi:hypothetical protein